MLKKVKPYPSKGNIQGSLQAFVFSLSRVLSFPLCFRMRIQKGTAVIGRYLNEIEKNMKRATFCQKESLM